MREKEGRNGDSDHRFMVTRLTEATTPESPSPEQVGAGLLGGTLWYRQRFCGEVRERRAFQWGHLQGCWVEINHVSHLGLEEDLG